MPNTKQSTTKNRTGKAAKPSTGLTTATRKPSRAPAAKVQAYADINGLPPGHAEQGTNGPHNLPLSFSPNQYAALEKAAEAAGMTVRDWSEYQLRSAARCAPGIEQENATHRLDIPRATFRHLEATAIQQGFRSVQDMILHVVTAYAWPADRVTVIGHWPDFNRWNQATQARGEILDAWILRSLNEAAELDLATRPAPEPNHYGATVFRKKKP